MLTWKKKDAIVTVCLKEYVNEELNRSEKAVSNKIDSIMKKGKQMYVAHQKKGETGKEYTHEGIDLEAAELAWPNFKTFLLIKDHPALGPGAVDDSAVTPSNVATEVVVPDEQEEDNSYTPEATRCPSRVSNKSTTAGVSVNDYEEDEEVPNPPKKSKGETTPLVVRIGKKKENRSNSVLGCLWRHGRECTDEADGA